MRNIRIIGTLGPASSDLETIRRLVSNGMNIARLNFSHGSRDEHLRMIGMIKQLRGETGKNIGILQDLSGPKIRTGILPDSGVNLEEGRLVTLAPDTGQKQESTKDRLLVSYPYLLEDIQPGSEIVLDDGRLELKCEQAVDQGLLCRVIRGGLLTSHKGVNFPGSSLSLKAPTPKDLEDLRFGLKHGVDFVALSFVQSADDIRTLKEEILKTDKKVSVIAKLERQVALGNLGDILAECDGVMVARGDLGIEADLTMVPIHQKRIVRDAISAGKFVIVATQMLESMMNSPLPTRAETTDIANAVYDGADAIMLSGETAVGKFPVEAVRTMARIAVNVEANLGLDKRLSEVQSRGTQYSQEMAVACSVCLAADELDASCIVAHTLSGRTARLIAQNRPVQPVFAVTPLTSTFYQLSVVWGVECLLVPDFEESFIDTLRKGDEALMRERLVKKGDLVVVAAGIPVGKSGGTNVMKVHTIGE